MRPRERVLARARGASARASRRLLRLADTAHGCHRCELAVAFAEARRLFDTCHYRRRVLVDRRAGASCRASQLVRDRSQPGDAARNWAPIRGWAEPRFRLGWSWEHGWVRAPWRQRARGACHGRARRCVIGCRSATTSSGCEPLQLEAALRSTRGARAAAERGILTELACESRGPRVTCPEYQQA